jgi:hypothetical protein
MHRLPCYDVKTGLAERRAFLGLGLMGVALIAIALLDSTRFAQRREEIAAVLSAPATVVADAQPVKGSTNVTSFQAKTPEESTRVNSFSRPKS